jgi:HlyD family secretion protein
MKSRFKTYASSLRTFIVSHKIWSLIIAVVIITVGYQVYARVHSSSGIPQYSVSRARTGSIIQTVTGTGQVSAANQLDLTSQVSGTIQSIDANVGQQVHTGDLIATIDATNALNSLKSAQLSFAKLTQAPKETDLSDATSSVAKAYDTGYNAVAATFTDAPSVMSSLKDMLYSQSGFLSNQRESYLSPTSRGYRDMAGQKYDASVNEYNTDLTEFKSLTRDSSQTDIDTLLSDTYRMASDIAGAVTAARNAISYIAQAQPEYYGSEVSSASANVNSWSSSMNGDVSSIVSAQNGIQSSANALKTLVAGTDPLDVQSAQLSLDQAQQTYNNYFVRAPFDGIIGRIPVSVYGQASGGTTIATIVGNQKIATLSLNEVDAAKVKAGDPVTLTFDAISDLTATGTVQSIDLVGTVSSGVVSYTAKVLIGTDDSRIIPGMSVNATIVTNEIDNVLIVPTTAIKTQGNQKYIQSLDSNTVSQYLSSLASANGSSSGSSNSGSQFTSSTRRFFASSTNSSSTDNFGNNASSTPRRMGGNARNISVTIQTSVSPQDITITTGASDDTNTEITGGLSGGEWIITKTTTSSSASSQTTTSAPSLLNSLGGNRAGGAAGGAFRATGGGGRGN